MGTKYVPRIYPAFLKLKLRPKRPQHETSLPVLHVGHAAEGAAFPVLGSVPRADGGIVRFRGGATGDEGREGGQREQEYELRDANLHFRWQDARG